MPALGLLILAAQVLCAIHVVRTGRPYWWLFLIVMVPAVGVIVYFVAELLPGLLGSRGARQAVSGAAKVFDPGRGVREAERQVEISPSAQNKAALANELLLAGQPEAAEALYREALTGIHATDPALMLGLARALFALGDAHETQVSWNGCGRPIRVTPRPMAICSMRGAWSSKGRRMLCSMSMLRLSLTTRARKRAPVMPCFSKGPGGSRRRRKSSRKFANRLTMGRATNTASSASGTSSPNGTSQHKAVPV